MIIRVKFGKEGALRFIGHLDVLRTFQKIFRRAGIPMAYSQGFSPHPIMSFALPLGLGFSSEGEYLDAEIEVDGILRFDQNDTKVCHPEEQSDEGSHTNQESARSLESDLLSAVRSSTSPDLPIYSLRILPDKTGNAMASVGRALYRLEIEPNQVQTLEQAARALLARESLMIEKETKTKTVEMDLRPCIYKLKVRRGVPCPPPVAGEGGPPAKPVVGGGDSKSYLIMEIAAGSKANVKPEMVWNALLGQINAFPSGEGGPPAKPVVDEVPLSIRRLDLLTEEGLSLGAIGQEI